MSVRAAWRRAVPDERRAARLSSPPLSSSSPPPFKDIRSLLFAVVCEPRVDGAEAVYEGGV